MKEKVRSKSGIEPRGRKKRKESALSTAPRFLEECF